MKKIYYMYKIIKYYIKYIINIKNNYLAAI